MWYGTTPVCHPGRRVSGITPDQTDAPRVPGWWILPGRIPPLPALLPHTRFSPFTPATPVGYSKTPDRPPAAPDLAAARCGTGPHLCTVQDGGEWRSWRSTQTPSQGLRHWPGRPRPSSPPQAAVTHGQHRPDFNGSSQYAEKSADRPTSLTAPGPRVWYGTTPHASSGTARTGRHAGSAACTPGP